MEKLVMAGEAMIDPPEGYMLGSMGELMDASGSTTTAPTPWATAYITTRTTCRWPTGSSY